MKRLLSAIILICVASAAPTQAKTRIYTFRSGPFLMGGFNTSLPKVRIRAPHVNGYITAVRTYLVYTDNRQVSIKNVMLHHTVFINSGRSSREFKGSCAGRFGEP